MKKSLIALAVLGTVAGAASAQTALTIYGLVDAGVVYERGIQGGAGAPSGNALKLTSGVQNGSRIGFKGSEDLGGGLSAKFLLESGFNIDSGTMGQADANAPNGRLFGRQAYVGLGGDWGNVLLGRQYTAHYLALAEVDPFGAGLAGNSTNVITTTLRTDNTIKYTSPSWSGVTGELAYSFGEVPGDNRASRQFGGAIGYNNGPLLVKLSHQNGNNATNTDNIKSTLLSGKWDFGPAAAHLGFNVTRGLGTTDSRDYLLGVSAPVGAGTFLASYIRKDDRTAANRDARQWALGYTHALSKRTNFYTSYARVINKNGSTFGVGNATETGSLAGTGDSQFNVGVRHVF